MRSLQNEPHVPVVKKAYSKPDLQVYGNLREITNSVTDAGSLTDTFYPGPPNRSH